MEIFAVQCEYSALYRCAITVRAEDAVAACRSAVDSANQSDAWNALDWEQPIYVVALAQGEDIDPWRQTPEGADGPALPVPGLFTDVAQLAGYSATRSEDLVLQLRIMVDPIGDDGRWRIDPAAAVRLCASGKAILDDIDRCGLPEKRQSRGEGSLAAA